MSKHCEELNIGPFSIKRYKGGVRHLKYKEQKHRVQ